jgi:hypothetical protein
VELKTSHQPVVISDLSGPGFLGWDDFLVLQEKQITILDLKSCFTLSPNQLANLLYAVKQSDKIIVLASSFIGHDVEDLLACSLKLDKVHTVELAFPAFQVED